MINWEDFDNNNHDYSPNELAELSRTNPDLYTKIVERNIPEGMSVHEWEQKNLSYMQKLLKQN
jgi:hypothetical protein